MSLEITQLFPGDGTKRLVISYKEGSDFDLVLQKLQSDSKTSQSNKGISKLIRTLVIATHGCKVFKHHPKVDNVKYEQFCLEALGVVSGYREIIRGYLSFLGATITEAHPTVDKSKQPSIEKAVDSSTLYDDTYNNKIKTKGKKDLSLINSLLPK